MPQKLGGGAYSRAASKRKRSSYDAAFKLRADNSYNYAAGRQFGVPTTYTRVNDFGQHMDSIFRGGRIIRGSDL